MKRKILLMTVLTLLMVALLSTTALAIPGTTRYYVTEAGGGNNSGSSWANASPNLKNIMNNAQAGDEIWVAAGSYSPGSERTDTFNLKKGIRIYGGFAGTETNLDDRNWETNETILDGKISEYEGVYHVITGGENATPEDTRLDGFIVRGGKVSHWDSHNTSNRNGAGMLNYNSSPTVANCTFTQNETAYYGGGMCNYNSSPTIDNCTFIENTARYGGGMYNDSYFDTGEEEPSCPKILNSTFSNNKTLQDGLGGGMYNDRSSPTLEDCTFLGNTAYYGGGMVNVSSSSPTLENCTFSGNEATYGRGGGMFNSYISNPSLKNCIFSGNKAETNGGGMHSQQNSTPTLVNCTFSGNEAIEGSGGGIDNSWSNTKLVNCTLSGNTANKNGGGIFNYASSPSLVNCTLSGNTANESGGGMYTDGTNNYYPQIIANTIFWDNSASQDMGEDIYYSGTYHATFLILKCVVGDYELGAYPSEILEDEIIQTDPKLIALDKEGNQVINPETNPTEVYVYELGEGSSALDSGLTVGSHNIYYNFEVPNVDQLGTPRPQGSGVDIGSYEVKVNSYTISYDANGGDGSMEPGTAYYGIGFNLPENEFLPPPGKKFKAWAIGSVTGTQLPPGTSLMFTADNTIYAIWESTTEPETSAPIIIPAKFEVNIESQGKGTATASPDKAEVGKEITLAAIPDKGWHFKEWQIVSGDVKIEDNKFIMPNGKVSLRAIFEKDAEPEVKRDYYDYSQFLFAYDDVKPSPKKESSPAKTEKMELQARLWIGEKNLEKNLSGVVSDIEMDVAPYIVEGRTMVPIRFVAEALGFEVEWLQDTWTVILKDGKNKIEIPVKTNKIIVNGEEYESDVAPVLEDGRTFLAIANVARALGLKDGTDVIWIPETQEVIIKRTIEVNI